MTDNEFPEKQHEIVPQAPPKSRTPPESSAKVAAHPHFPRRRLKAPKFRFSDAVRDRLLVPALDRLLYGHKPEKVARQLLELIKCDAPDVNLNRNTVYRLAHYGWMEGLVQVFAKPEQVLARDLMEGSNFGEIMVIPDREGLVENPVAQAGAKVVYELIGQTARKREGPVHVGLGIGQSTRYLAQLLALMIGADRPAPDLCFHALTTGHSVWDPLETPLTFFSYFAGGESCRTEFVGLFARPLVPVEEYEDEIRSRLVQPAFERRDEIDIVVTSIASSADPHGHLYQYLERFVDEDAPEKLRDRGWVGDQQLRPYGAEGPMSITEGMKPVTLFEIDDLVTFAHHPGKHVVVLCSPCGKCGRIKEDALRPLLTSPGLHIWNHLLLDARTALEVFPDRGKENA